MESLSIFASPENFLDLLRLHAHAVVLHPKADMSILQKASSQNQEPILSLRLQTVGDGVFHQRLQDHFRNAILQNGRIHLLLRLKHPFKAHELDPDVRSGRGKLLPDRNHILPLDAVLENFTEIPHHLRRLRRFLQIGHPHNAFQCVIKKMGVDLAAQVEKLRLLLLQLRFVKVGRSPHQLVGQRVDFPDHPVEFVGDLAHLPVSVQLHLLL